MAAPNPALPFQHVERAGHAARRPHRRQRASLRRVPGVQRLGHGVGPEGLLERRRHGAGAGEGMGRAHRIQIQQAGDGGGSAERADRAGGVPEPVMRGLHGQADARRDLVSHHNRAQQRRAVGAPRLCRGQGGPDHRAARVVDRVAEDVVELDRVRCGRIDQRRRPQRRAPQAGVDQGAAAGLVVQRGVQQRGRGQPAARQQRREPVDQGPARMVAHRLRQNAPRFGGGVFGQSLDDGRHRVSPGRSGRRGRACASAPATRARRTDAAPPAGRDGWSWRSPRPTAALGHRRSPSP